VPDVAATFFAPFPSNPDCSRMRRSAISAGNPDIAMTIPTVVPRNPDPAGARRSWHNFNRSRRRRTYTDDNLSVGGADGKTKSGHGDQESAFQIHENLRLLV